MTRTHITVEALSGRLIDWYDVVDLMDPELVEELHSQLEPTTEQALFTAYEAAHLIAYGELWGPSKTN